MNLIFLEKDQPIFINEMTPPTILAEEPRGSYRWGGTFIYILSIIPLKVKFYIYQNVYNFLLQKHYFFKSYKIILKQQFKIKFF